MFLVKYRNVIGSSLCSSFVFFFEAFTEGDMVTHGHWHLSPSTGIAIKTGTVLLSLPKVGTCLVLELGGRSTYYGSRSDAGHYSSAMIISSIF